jgi:hypothetical protein
MAFDEGMSAALKENEGRDATRMTPDSDRIRLSALSQASIPQSINGLANEAMMGDCYEHGTVPCRQLRVEKLEERGKRPVHDEALFILNKSIQQRRVGWGEDRVSAQSRNHVLGAYLIDNGFFFLVCDDGSCNSITSEYLTIKCLLNRLRGRGMPLLPRSPNGPLTL